MSRLTLVCVLAVCISISIIVAEAKKKDKWREKKSHLGSAIATDGRSKSRSRSIINDLEKDKKDVHGDILGKKHRGFDNWRSKRKWRKAKSKRGKHHKKSKSRRRNKGGMMTKNMPWLNFLPGDDCNPKCTKQEVCIMGPLEAKPLCVHFKDLKKSMKMFRKYKKKEKKAWKKFHKKNYNHFKDQDVFDFKDEKKYDHDDDQKRKLGIELSLMKKNEIISRKPESSVQVPVIALEPSEGGNPKECRTEDFSQMRTRIMGWFHLLRSQDKRLKKEQKKRLGHKHSVKKELEAGDKCQCMQSAMYEFDEMDEDGDGHLIDREMAVLEGNGMEPCMRPYITSCDHNADGMLSSAEWCCCFANVLGPCYRQMDEIRKSGERVTYMPRCDKEGYYVPEQCKRVDLDKFECWCVDFNGNLIEGSKTGGRAHCNDFKVNGF